MNTTEITSLQPHVVQLDGTVFAISNEVAAVFGKEHKDVLKAVDRLKSELAELKSVGNDEISRRNFAPRDSVKRASETDFVESEYLHARGKVERCVLMTRAAFSLLVLGFIGQRALRFKVEYIYQFDRMEHELYGDRGSDLNRLRERVEQRFPLFKPLREDYIKRALSMPALCEKYGKSPDSLRNMGHAMVREGYVREEELVLARRGLAVWNAMIAKRSQMSLDLTPA